ncbi:hypothetical protein BX265_7002 [Streptomyces sp. TLI_235]|nr:hypothetical protein [Streptomyces sp. TLI_235]PBC69664.1 hypothetical protein BX265_7002 [Streptomyces sp. TLI_235]
MTDLKWRTVADLRLTPAAAIPNPNGTANSLTSLINTSVAIDNGLVHIDLRTINGQAPTDTHAEYTVHVVPTSAVEYIRYQVTPKSGQTVAM